MKKADTTAGTIPAIDPGNPWLVGLLSLAPVSGWCSAGIDAHGTIEPPVGSRVDVTELRDELKRQRARAPIGPRIAATLVPLGIYASGVTLVFADARTDFAILILLRAAELGPFTSSEISMLTFALDAGSERLAALRLQPETDEFAAPSTPPPDGGAFYVLDDAFEIVLAWSAERQQRIAVSGTSDLIAEHLPAVLEASVRELTASWSSDGRREPGVARPVPFLVVRTQPMSGPGGLFIGVRIDRFHAPNSLTGAAARFRISPREIQVLALLLDGEHLDHIAKRLFITSSTVQDHIKSMLDKTASRNRSELIARILGWEAPPNPRAT